MGCSGGTLDACPIGSTLVFRTELATAQGYLVAYADPLFSGAERVWYWQGASSPLVDPAPGPTVLARGVRLGPEHVPGTYALHLIVARRRLEIEETPNIDPHDVLSEQRLLLVVRP